MSQASYGTGGNGNNAARSRAKRSPIVSVCRRNRCPRRARHWRSKSAFNASPTGDARDRHEEVAAGVADQPFHLAFVVALPRSSEAIVEQVVRLEFAEDLGPLARAVTENPRHRQLGVVVDDATRYAAEIVKRRVVPVTERLRRLGRKRLHERVVAVRQIHDQVVRLAFEAGDDHQRFTEVGLGVARRVHERHEHLLPASFRRRT